VEAPSALDLVPPRSAQAGREFAPHRMLRLQAWPEMRYLAPDQVARHTRICALLAVRPSVAYLVHRRLGLAPDVVMPVLRALHGRGFLEVVADGLEADDQPMSGYPDDDGLRPVAPPAQASSRWARLARKVRG